MTEEEKLDVGLPYDFCESGCKLRKNRTVYSVVSGRTTKDFGAFMLRETLWFPPQFRSGYQRYMYPQPPQFANEK